MTKTRLILLPIATTIAILTLAGCEQFEQAKTDTLEKAKQTAAKALNEAQQSPPLEQARESANQVLIESKKAASDLLDQASQYLDQGSKIIENSPTQESSGS